MPGTLGMKPEDWVRSSLNYSADQSVHLRIRQKKTLAKGGEAAAHIIVSGSTGDITFEQGANTAAADTTTGDNPQVGATPGIINLSDLVSSTYHALQLAINATDDWECWLEGALPDDNPEASGGVGNFIVQSDLDCTTDAGAAVVGDDSKALFSGAQLSFWDSDVNPHRHDGQVLHELLQAKATFTFTGAAQFRVFSCDDIAGTSTEILNIGAGASTVEALLPTDAGIGEPIASTKSARLVVKFEAATTLTVSSLYINGRSYAFGPGIRAANLESAQ